MASEMKRWLLLRTTLSEEQVLLQGGGDTAWPAWEMQPHDIQELVPSLGCVILLQTNGVLKQPAALALLYSAVQHAVPLVPVVFGTARAARTRPA